MLWERLNKKRFYVIIKITIVSKIKENEPDEDNPEIDPVETPKQYEALMKAVAERNQRIARSQKELA